MSSYGKIFFFATNSFHNCSPLFSDNIFIDVFLSFIKFTGLSNSIIFNKSSILSLNLFFANNNRINFCIIIILLFFMELKGEFDLVYFLEDVFNLSTE